MLRRPLFWALFIAFSLLATIFTIRNFSTAFPLVSIDLRMDREAALSTARTLADKYAWPPQGFREAAQFSSDQEVQYFIELEGGGKPELTRIFKEKIFAPYTWRVRLFKEADAHETLVRFTPEGEPYGFEVKLPESEKGATKSVEEAQHIAEAAAKADWNIDFGRYQLVESSKQERPSGRTDHTFVYERQDERLREGRYRLRLVVAGDKLTELTHFVQIPQAFSRRYQEMRAKNEAINTASVVGVGIYLIAFCGIGLFFMARQHWVLWRQAALWSVLIAMLMGLDRLNSWPLLWMQYDTALPASGFAIQQVFAAVGVFGALAILLMVSFMAAETLSRRAFPHHVQLWKVWSHPVAASPTVFGETLGGYLLVAPFFAYEIILYFFAQGRLGWWTPSDTLVSPDMFANYLPSLSAIAQAAQAGFWEECLFRAVPLSVAALIGVRFGKPRTFIAAGMILQAIVFASGHAGYANQPAYARVVELIIPSFAFGTIFLLFGLLPGIVLHFAYDTAWMALPLFVSSTPRAHVEQAIVILAVLLPLWIVIYQRARAGKWIEVTPDAMNGGWRPPETLTPQAEVVYEPAPSALSVRVTTALPLIGIAGLAVWIFASSFHTDAPPMRIGRAEAENSARQVLADRHVQLDSSWTVLSRVEGQPGPMNRFVWQKAGRERYAKLLGVYVTPPTWFVRFARFKGDVAERAEEYQVYVDGDGKLFRVSHELPEARPGKSLTETEARAIATSSLSDPSVFKEVSAEASKKPARTDWTFVFKDTRDYGLPEGEPRVSIEIAGDQVVDTSRYVYVPEDWARNERAQQNLPTIFTIVCTLLLIAIVAAAAVVGVIRWSRKGAFSGRVFAAVFAVVLLIAIINAINNWPVLASQALTTQPLELQIGIFLITSLLVAVFTAVGFGLVAGLVVTKMPQLVGLSFGRGILLGASVAFAMAGAGALARRLIPSTSPSWGNLAPLSASWPFVADALSVLSAFFAQALILLVVFYAAHRRSRVGVLWVLMGIVLAGNSIQTISSWLIIGAVTGVALWLAYTFVFRHQAQLLLIAVATIVILSGLREGLQRVFPSVLPASIAGAALIALVVWVWIRGSIGKSPV